ncbi:MAG: hypothetical protein ACJ8R9_22570 [Steroidobacteraceae bacterium]
MSSRFVASNPAVRALLQAWPWVVLLVLLSVCVVHGLWVVRGLGGYTALLDTYRDAGFVQGFMDGNLSGDPSIEGAKRYYPPLLHALAALVASIAHTQPLQLLVGAAPWVNLLIPTTFFLMVRRLIDAAAAAIATVLLVCFDGTLLPPWMAASYSPWHSVPALTQALFFCCVWLLSARAQRGRFGDAFLIGSMLGLVFLAHTVPALILAVITAAAAVSTQGMRMRTVAWVGTVALTAILWSLPFMMPLLTTYHLKILSPAGAFTDDLFDPSRIPKRVIAACLPGLGALALLGWNYWRARPFGRTVAPATVVILGVWILLPLFFIVRHFACGVGGTAAVCTTFVVPVHHWMFYAQSALACVFGYVVVSGLAPQTGPRAAANPTAASFATVVAASGAFALACAVLSFRPTDQAMRERALDMRNRVDLELYQWMLRSTPPDTLFVTDISTNGVHDSAALAVLAAGRKSVALPFTYSNPYIDWQTRKQHEEAYLAAALSGKDSGTLCHLLGEAGNGSRVYIALAAGTDAPAGQLQPVFRSTENHVYSVMPSVCR